MLALWSSGCEGELNETFCSMTIEGFWSSSTLTCLRIYEENTSWDESWEACAAEPGVQSWGSGLSGRLAHVRTQAVLNLVSDDGSFDEMWIGLRELILNNHSFAWVDGPNGLTPVACFNTLVYATNPPTDKLGDDNQPCGRVFRKKSDDPFQCAGDLPTLFIPISLLQSSRFHDTDCAGQHYRLCEFFKGSQKRRVINLSAMKELVEEGTVSKEKTEACSPPHCHLSDLSAVEKGVASLEQSGRSAAGDRANLSCAKGFKLSDGSSDVYVCDSNSRWQPSPDTALCLPDLPYCSNQLLNNATIPGGTILFPDPRKTNVCQRPFLS